ncbi:MAG: PstS family phosphate ABC transporter substrate-binding protein [Spirochaetes bacterium]|nr:PstS family phosphate ABC transporter substrate-binding protein [Spirochaetota bacterium]
MLKKSENILKIFIIIAVFTFGASIFGCSRDKGTKIVVKGSTTVLPITQRTAEEYRKKNKVAISIEGSGSGNGIKALIDGSCDIANSSREIKDKEIAKAKENSIEVKEIVVAYDMIVPVVHPSNPVNSLSVDQLKAIYNGSIINWEQFGGKNEKIVVISRDTSSGTYEVWYEKVMKKTDVARSALLQASNGAIVSAVTQNPKAIGYIGYGYLNDSIKPLKVNGIEGTISNGKSGKFPISRKLYMYVNEKKLSKEAKAYIDFILSPEGQDFVKETGYIPL